MLKTEDPVCCNQDLVQPNKLNRYFLKRERVGISGQMEQVFMSLWDRGMKKYISFIATVLLIINNLSIFCLPG